MNPRQSKVGRIKTVYERALPKVFVSDDAEFAQYGKQVIESKLQELDNAVKQFDILSAQAIEPINLGFRRTACGCCFKSLFHEVKQMGIVLRKAFKGTHIWIPPIEQQLKDNQKFDKEEIKNKHSNVS